MTLHREVPELGRPTPVASGTGCRAECESCLDPALSDQSALRSKVKSEAVVLWTSCHEETAS